MPKRPTPPKRSLINEGAISAMINPLMTPRILKAMASQGRTAQQPGPPAFIPPKGKRGKGR